MRLNAVHLVNFRQHSDTRVAFDRGLTGIIGPNGSGKTTILEAIAWALYGNAAARGTRESIRHNRAGAGSRVQVELDFELSGHRYRVVRRLTSAELYLDGAETPIANSITGVTDLLQRRLGMSRAEFFNTYFTGQKELNVMAAMGPSERAQFLSRVLGYEKLRAAQSLVRERRKLIVAEVSGVRSALPDPVGVEQASIDAARRAQDADQRLALATKAHMAAAASLATLAPRWAEAQVDREALRQVLADLRVAEGEETSLRRERERFEREIGEIALARVELDELKVALAPWDALVAELHNLDRLYSEEGRRQTLQENERQLVDDLAKIAARREKIATAPQLEEEVTLQLEGKRRDFEQVSGELEARRTDWVRDRQEAETKRDALRAQYAELKVQRDRVVAAGTEGKCPTCARPLGVSYQSVLELLDEQLETVRVDGGYYKNRLEQLDEMPEDVKALDERRRGVQQEVGLVERKLAKVQLAVQELAQLQREAQGKDERLAKVRADLAKIPGGYDKVRHAEVRAQMDRLSPLDARAARLGALVDRAPQLERDRQRVSGSLTGVEERVAALRARRDAVTLTERDFEALRVDYDRAAAEARATELAAVASQGELESARTAHEAARRQREELERMRERLAKLEGEKRLHDELDRAYSDLRTDLNFQLRPELSELASAFLTDLTDARYSELELDDQYNVLVLEDGIPKPVISGGEEDLANLVLRLAISQMIAERAGQQFSLLILDEVFGSLDESRRHNVVELLRRLHDRFEQVILITHIDSVREGLDRVMTVRFDEEAGCSRVRLGDDEAEGDDAPSSLADAAFEGSEAAD